MLARSVRVRVRPFAAVVALALLVVPAAPSAAAQQAVPADTRAADVDDFAYRSYDARFRLGITEDGRARMHVTEKWVAVFPETDQNRGIVRGIPTGYRGARTEPENVAVTDAGGRRVPFTSSDESRNGTGYDVLSIDDDTFKHGDTTYVIDYDLENVVVPPTSGTQPGDEFYWNVLGDVAQPIGSASATVVVPARLAERTTGRTRCFTGPAGSRATCSLEADRDSATTYRTTRLSVPAHDRWTVDIEFRKGTFAAPPMPQSTWAAHWSGLVAAIAAAVAFLVSFTARRAIWRDRRGRGVVVPQYEPDPRIGFRAAALLGRASTARVVTAEVLALAVAGAVRIVESPVGRGKASFYLLLVSPGLSGDAPVTAELNRVIRALFPNGRENDTTKLTGAGGERERLRAVDDDGVLAAEGYRRKPDGALPAVLGRVLGIAALASAVALVVVGIATGFVNGLVVAGAIALVASGIGCLVVSARPWRLTDRGADARDRLRGLREFIRLAEADRLRFLQSVDGADRIDTSDAGRVVQLKETLLPWAAFFGQERSWAAELAADYERSGDEPRWYAGHDGFQAAAFAGVLTQVSTSSQAASVPASAASSSGSSGFSGGGFSGGGGGGGFSGGR